MPFGIRFIYRILYIHIVASTSIVIDRDFNFYVFKVWIVYDRYNSFFVLFLKNFVKKTKISLKSEILLGI